MRILFAPHGTRGDIQPLAFDYERAKREAQMRARLEAIYGSRRDAATLVAPASVPSGAAVRFEVPI